MSARENPMVGAAGEFYVLARLSLLGKIAAQAPKGAPTADILIASSSGDRLCSVQVKARQEKGSDHGWYMSKKHEAIKSPSLFYAFVDFGKLTEPKPITYIVPSAVVAEVLQSMHRAWLSNPGQRGQQRRDTDFRRFMPDYSRTSGNAVGKYVGGWLDQYREAWDLLP
jgi:hypothetical protein